MASVNLGAGRYPVAIAAGRWHTCALLDNDDVKVRGYTHLTCLPSLFIPLFFTRCVCACARVIANNACCVGHQGEFFVATTALKQKTEGKMGSARGSLE